MNKVKPFAIVSVCLLLGFVAAMQTGCLLHKVTTVTGDAASGFVTNTTTVVDDVVLEGYCAGLQLVGTPAVTYALSKDPSAKPIVQDIQMALNGALNGADSNVVATVEGFLGKNQALDDQLTPLIKAASDLRGRLLAKYGDKAAVQITTAILRTDLSIVNAALAATK